MRRSDAEISLEISALEALAGGYDTPEETRSTVIAASAHDALRWALGLSEEPLSETLEP